MHFSLSKALIFAVTLIAAMADDCPWYYGTRSTITGINHCAKPIAFAKIRDGEFDDASPVPPKGMFRINGPENPKQNDNVQVGVYAEVEKGKDKGDFLHASITFANGE